MFKAKDLNINRQNTIIFFFRLLIVTLFIVCVTNIFTFKLFQANVQCTRMFNFASKKSPRPLYTIPRLF